MNNVLSLSPYITHDAHVQPGVQENAGCHKMSGKSGQREVQSVVAVKVFSIIFPRKQDRFIELFHSTIEQDL
jgi:hypothetical protein